MIIALEGGIGIFNVFFKENQKTKVLTRFDAISGYRICQIEDLNGISYKGNECNRHGLFVTPYESNSKNSKNNIGILLSGNSVAKGDGISSKSNIKAFPGQLEKYLREENKLIDIVNITEGGYNSWQDNVEITRYFNAYKVNNDLPSIKVIISFGGMVDFFNFIELLKKENFNESEYMRANGLMINKETLDFADIFQKVLNGNLFANINLFMQSIASGIRANSELFNLTNERYLAARQLLKKAYLNHKNESSKTENINNAEVLKIENIIKKFDLDLESYNFIKEYVTDSVVRNYRASSSLSDAKFIFAYSPSFFSGLDKSLNINEPLIPINKLKGKYLYHLEIKELEKDYRKTLLKKLKAYEKILVIDYSLFGNSENWFLDNSHFNVFGSKKMAKIVSEDIIKIISNQD